MRTIQNLIFACALLLPFSVQAELPWEFDQHTRYMALGDSLAAGYGAVPATQGYVYLLYQNGSFDTVPNTLLSNAGVPGATSGDVLNYQVPQAIDAFRPKHITLTVGGNDLVAILNGADPNDVLAAFQNNLAQVLGALRAQLPTANIYVSNLYSISEIPGADNVVPIFNQIVAGVASAFNVRVADVHGEFEGRGGLLLIDRNGAGQFEVHPTNAGHRAIFRAFEAVIEQDQN